MKKGILILFFLGIFVLMQVSFVSGYYNYICGDTNFDVAVFDDVNGVWYIGENDGGGVFGPNIGDYPTRWGYPGVKAVPGDYDGDGLFDLAVYDESGGGWHVLGHGDNTILSDNSFWGFSGARAVPGDYDGDGVWDFAVYDTSNGNWHIRNIRNGPPIISEYNFGDSNKIPVPGDYDGDGIFDLATFDKSIFKWNIRKNNGDGTIGGNILVDFGHGFATTNIPTPGDYDGDGVWDLAIFDVDGIGNDDWWIIDIGGNSITNPYPIDWGGPGMIPVPGDYNADGIFDLSVYELSSGDWYIRGLDNLGVPKSPAIANPNNWGYSGARPVSGDYNGDGCPIISEANWTNLRGEKIEGANISDTVRLFTGAKKLGGDQITFKIYEVGDLINPIIPPIVSGENYVNWKAEEGNYIFTVEDLFGNIVTSKTISVTNPEDNEEPVAIISFPLHRGIFFMGTNVTFGQGSYDEDDPISIEWNFAGVTNSESAFNHKFITPGRKIIDLKVTDSRGLDDHDQVAVLIVDNINNKQIFSYINDPGFDEIVLEEDLIVDYYANESYVIDFADSGSCNVFVACLAGNCPQKTIGGPLCDIRFNIELINNNNDFSSFNFKWTFDVDSVTTIIEGIGDSFKNGIIGYAVQGVKVILLDLKYDAGGPIFEDNYTREFELASRCSGDGRTFYIVDQTDGSITGSQSTLDTSACAGANGVVGGGDDCCPNGYTCSLDPSDLGCFIDTSITNLGCRTYTDSSSCVAFEESVIRQDLLWDEEGCETTLPFNSQTGHNVRCECKWNNKCNLHKTTRESNDPENPIGYKDCNVDITRGTCVSGFEDVTIDYTLTGFGNDPPQEICPTFSSPVSKKLKCGLPFASLPFFGVYQSIISVVFIGVIYMIILTRRRN